MEVHSQQIDEFQHPQLPILEPQFTKNLQQLAFQTTSEQTTSPIGSNQKSDRSENDRESENSTEPDNVAGYISLKSIKSKEEIEIESKQNQEILLNLNFNIDDLFRKISSLTEEITTQLQPKQVKERHSPIKIDRLTINQQSNDFPQKQKAKSTSFIEFKSRFPNIQQKTEYKPIFFQYHRSVTKQYSINMKLFQTGKSLGCGKFGEVVQCRNLKTNALYALKKIFKSVIDEYKMEQQLLTQLKILSQIDHPNIVKAYQAFTDDFHIFILMEYVHGPLLVKKLKCTEQQCKIIIKQVLEALKYLHENKISHRDIKPQNIILTADNVVKICDFGWASQGTEKMDILCGTLDYVSPQMAKQQEYTEKSDLWNLGVLAYELIHGYPPFKASSKSRIFQRVRSLEYSFSDQIQISQECKSFITGFLKNQNERQSIEWGLNHEFLKIQEETNKENTIDAEVIKEMAQIWNE